LNRSAILSPHPASDHKRLAIVIDPDGYRLPCRSSNGQLIGGLPLRNARPMTIASSAPSRLTHLLTLSLLLAPIPAAAAPPRKVAAARSGPFTVAATTTIIALPLNPTLPAGQRLCTSKAADELGYVMLRPESGALPGKADYLLVNYIGYLAATGVVFDQGCSPPFW
jgi:FKBP-type peptidyl-prolyl cis-trans isomerase FkpA